MGDIFSYYLIYSLLFLFGFLLSLALVYDARYYRIPNLIPLLLIVCFVISSLTTGLSWKEVTPNILGFLISLSIGMLLFALKLSGGGDGKILAAASLWLGYGYLPELYITTSIVGGILSLIFLAARSKTMIYMSPFIASLYYNKSHQAAALNSGSKDVIPYGIAICISSIITFPESDTFQNIIDAISKS